MGKNLEKVFAAAVEGDFDKMEHEIRAFTEDFDSRPQLRFMGAQRAADAGHREKAAEFAKTLKVSDGDKTLAHLNLAAKYIAGEDKLPFDLSLIEHHLLELRKGLEAKMVDAGTSELLVRNRYKKLKKKEVQELFRNVFGGPPWNLT